jgi:hypothetical protein
MSKALSENFGFLDKLDDLTAVTTQADTTLTIWGHGDNKSLGGRSPELLAIELRDKKLKDTSIKTIELLSCNPSIADNEDTMSYAEALARAVATLFKQRKVTVKTFPAATGKVSLLWYIYAIDEFIYFQAKDEETLSLVQGEVEKLSEWDAPMLRDILPKHFELLRKQRGLEYKRGHISQLRSMLVPVAGASY